MSKVSELIQNVVEAGFEYDKDIESNVKKLKMAVAVAELSDFMEYGEVELTLEDFRPFEQHIGLIDVLLHGFCANCLGVLQN